MNIIFYKLQNKLNDAGKLRTLTSSDGISKVTKAYCNTKGGY